MMWENYVLLIIALLILLGACMTGTFDCKQCEIYEANQTQINLTAESESQ
jgi:hypothetical protein